MTRYIKALLRAMLVTSVIGVVLLSPAPAGAQPAKCWPVGEAPPVCSAWEWTTQNAVCRAKKKRQTEERAEACLREKGEKEIDKVAPEGWKAFVSHFEEVSISPSDFTVGRSLGQGAIIFWVMAGLYLLLLREWKEKDRWRIRPALGGYFLGVILGWGYEFCRTGPTEGYQQTSQLILGGAGLLFVGGIAANRQWFSLALKAKRGGKFWYFFFRGTLPPELLVVEGEAASKTAPSEQGGSHATSPSAKAEEPPAPPVRVEGPGLGKSSALRELPGLAPAKATRPAPAANALTCKSCGKKASPGAKFCGGCSRPLRK